MVLPWLAIALPGAALAVGVVAFGAVFIAKNKCKRPKKRDFACKYHFEGILGRGSFGHVYKIISRKDGRKYALKILEMKAARISLGAVEREIGLMRSLDHPHIVRFHGAFHCRTLVAIQMEYCPGGDLRKLIKRIRGKRLPYERVHLWMLQLGSALEYVHSKDVMHRDLKPENVLIGADSRLLLADFGIARMLTSGYACSKHGTKSFMAPEAFQGRYDKKADVYSMGCVFLCMVSIQTLPRKTPSIWSAIPKHYGETIFGIIDRCMSLNKDCRPHASDICELLLTRRTVHT